MTVIALCLAKEERWIGQAIDHLYANGVDEVHVELDDLDDWTGHLVEKHDAIPHWNPVGYWQSQRITDLAAKVAAPGDWVIPFDADEFWYANGGPIASVLNRLPETVRKLYARMYLHRDNDHRRRDPKPLPKVAFRYEPGVVIGDGNHDCSLPGGVWGVLDLREIQYRSFEHFLEKVDKTRRLHENTPDLPAGFGVHMRRLLGLTSSELIHEWELMCGGEWCFDPIPSP